MLWLSASALLFGFGTNVLLGRVGPGALGFYGFLTLTLSLVSALLVFGGANVLINYLPRTDAREKRRFFKRCAAAVAGVSLVFLLPVLAFPSILRSLYGDARVESLVLYIVLFFPLALLETLLWSALQGELEFRVVGVAHQLVSAVNFLFVAVVALAWGSEVTATSIRPWILASVVLANGASIVFTATQLYRRRWRTWPRAGPGRSRLPAGFWRFTGFFHASSIVQFVVRSLDQLFVLGALGLVQLGFYRAAFVLAQLVNWFSMVTDRAFYGTLCNVTADVQPDLHERFTRLNALGTGLVGMGVITFSSEAITFFGESSSQSARIVLLVLASSILASYPLTSVNNAVIAARGRTDWIFFENALGALCAIALYHVLGRSFGLLGVAYAFASLQVVLLLLSTSIVNHVAGIHFPRRVYAIILSAIAVSLAGAELLSGPAPGRIAARAALIAGFLPLLRVTRIVSKPEVAEFVSLLMPGRRFARREH